MNKLLNFSKRTTAFLAAVLLLVGLAIPTVIPKQSHAAQLTTRSLQISSSANGGISTDAGGNNVSAGAGGNGTKAQHTVTFTLGTTAPTDGSILIMYCDSPIPQSTCNTPTGLDASHLTSATVTSPNSTLTSPGGYSIDTSTTNASINGSVHTTLSLGNCNGAGSSRQNCVAIKRTSGQVESGTPQVQVAYGGGGSNYVTNPTTDNYSFYARIFVFSDTAWSTLVDYGGVAASTAQQVDITAKVQEVLNFSVGTTATSPSTTCAPYTDSGALALGDVNGVLSSATSYYADSYFRVSSNSLHGTSIYYSGDTLKNGANSIASVGLTAGGTASATNTSQFGLGIDSGGTDYNFTDLTAATSPDDYSLGNSGNNKFQFDTASTTALGSNDKIASSSGGIACDTGAVRYVGNVSTSVPAGIYTTTITYIAVGTY